MPYVKEIRLIVLFASCEALDKKNFFVSIYRNNYVMPDDTI